MIEKCDEILKNPNQVMAIYREVEDGKTMTDICEKIITYMPSKY